jgi:hypothetical protein
MASDHHSKMMWGESTKSLISNPNYIEGCERTRLVQRLSPPHEEYTGAWSFGCGHKHGGLNQEAWNIITKLCFFEYMGSAEFEFGALPKAFQSMVSNMDDLEAYLVYVVGSPEFPFNRKFNAYGYEELESIKKKHPIEATVFVLAPKHIRPHVEETIHAIVFDEQRLQDPANLNDTIFCDPEWDERSEWARKKTCGWIELDNGFMFFSNEDMWRDFCRLFGVPDPELVELPVKIPDFGPVNEALAKCPKRE